MFRHHRESAALFAGARRFDRGVERKQVGLVGDVLDGGVEVAEVHGGSGEESVHERGSVIVVGHFVGGGEAIEGDVDGGHAEGFLRGRGIGDAGAVVGDDGVDGEGVGRAIEDTARELGDLGLIAEDVVGAEIERGPS